MDKDFLRTTVINCRDACSQFLELSYTETQRVWMQRLTIYNYILMLINKDKVDEALLMLEEWDKILNPKAEEEAKERDKENSSSTGN